MVTRRVHVIALGEEKVQHNDNFIFFLQKTTWLPTLIVVVAPSRSKPDCRVHEWRPCDNGWIC